MFYVKHISEKAGSTGKIYNFLLKKLYTLLKKKQLLTAPNIQRKKIKAKNKRLIQIKNFGSHFLPFRVAHNEKSIIYKIYNFQITKIIVVNNKIRVSMLNFVSLLSFSLAKAPVL